MGPVVIADGLECKDYLHLQGKHLVLKITQREMLCAAHSWHVRGADGAGWHKAGVLPHMGPNKNRCVTEGLGLVAR